MGISVLHCYDWQAISKAYTDKTLLYKYKREVGVPHMGMVDNVLTIQKCKSTLSAINTEVNAFF